MGADGGWVCSKNVGSAYTKAIDFIRVSAYFVFAKAGQKG